MNEEREYFESIAVTGDPMRLEAYVVVKRWGQMPPIDWLQGNCTKRA
jgi:hypothetical protein